MKRRTLKDKELADRTTLARAWHKWHVEQLEEALAGVHGAVLERLMAHLKELCSGSELTDFIAARDWNRVDANTRMVALHEINRAITKLRERADEETPINDPLPGQPLNAFLLAKQIITNTPPRGRTEPGSGTSSGQPVTREAKEYVS